MSRTRMVWIAFRQLMIQIRKDPMLLVACFAPILCALVFKFGIPIIEEIICKQFDFTKFLSPYYILFDCFLGMMAPLMFCFTTAMVILMEVDDRISNYYFVTPLGKSGYLSSRLFIPGLIGFVVSVILMMNFSLTKNSFVFWLLIALISAMMGVIVTLMVVTLSSNKVEGMAVAKLSGLFLMGIIIPYFVESPVQYLSAILPSYFMGRFVMDQNYLMLLPAFVSCIVWAILLTRRFIRKL